MLLERKTSLAGHSHTKILNLWFRKFTAGLMLRLWSLELGRHGGGVTLSQDWL
jgi:hypothetical protein